VAERGNMFTRDGPFKADSHLRGNDGSKSLLPFFWHPARLTDRFRNLDSRLRGNEEIAAVRRGNDDV
jgi:hypothetical protein